MKKGFGFTRTIKSNWLDFVFELVCEETDEEIIIQKINEYLSYEIKDSTNLAKTRRILMNIWFYERERPILNTAKNLLKKSAENKLLINWCLMLTAYPVFAELIEVIGNLAEFQEEITLKQITQKIYDTRGETSTLFYSVQKLISTLINLGALNKTKAGVYRIRSFKIEQSDTIKFLIETLLMIDKSSYHNFSDLRKSKYFYLFEYDITLEDFYNDDRFLLNRFGDEMALSLKV